MIERNMYIGTLIDKDKVRSDAYKKAATERVHVHHHKYNDACNDACEVFEVRSEE